MYIFILCYGMYYLNDTSITINNILRFMSVFIKIYIDLCVFVTSRKKWLSIEYVYVKNRVQINIDVYIHLILWYVLPL